MYLEKQLYYKYNASYSFQSSLIAHTTAVGSLVRLLLLEKYPQKNILVHPKHFHVSRS